MLGLGAAWPLKILPWTPSLLPSGGPTSLGLASCPDGGGLSSVAVPLQILLARLARPLRDQGQPAAVGMACVPLPFWADAGGLSVSSCRPGCTQICFAWCVHSLAASPQTSLPDRAHSL